MEEKIIVLPLILPMAISFVSEKLFDKAIDVSGDVTKDIISKITLKTLGKDIFNKKVKDMKVDDLQGLLNTQVSEFRQIIQEEVTPYLNENETNELISGVSFELKNILGNIESSIDGFESLFADACKEWRMHQDIMGNEWRTFSEEFFRQFEEMQGFQFDAILRNLKMEFAVIEQEIKSMRLEIKEQTYEIKQTKELISDKFEKLELFLQQIGAMQIDDSMDSAILHQKYKKILSSITCPVCSFTTTDIRKEGENWFCPMCKGQIDSDLMDNIRNELNLTKLIALSVFNQAMTIKNSRGDIQFQNDIYVPRKDVEEAFFTFQSRKGNPKSKLFLLLGDAGIGKTWTAASICDKYSRLFPVFYFSLRGPVLNEMKALFLGNPKYYGINTVFERIRDVRKKDKKLRILLVFDGFDEIYEDDKQRWFIFEILKSLRKIPGVMIILTCRLYDWFENRFYKQESGWLDTLTWKKGIKMKKYSDIEYLRIMEPLEIIAPVGDWEEHWGQELKRPFLQAIIQKLAFESSPPKFIGINDARFFKLLERRLGIVNADQPILVEFAENNLTRVKYLTRTSFSDQKLISSLLSAGLIKEKPQEKGGYNPFPELIISGPFEEAYCHYLRFWMIRLKSPDKLFEIWTGFKENQRVKTRVKKWVTLLVKENPDLKKLLSEDAIESQYTSSPKPEAEVPKRTGGEMIKNIKIIDSIYKKSQIPLIRLSAKSQTTIDETTEIIENLLREGIIKGHIDDRGSVQASDYVLVLAKEWNIEEKNWRILKKHLEDSKESLNKNINNAEGFLFTSETSEIKLDKSAKQLDEVQEKVDVSLSEINNLGDHTFITEIGDELNSFLEVYFPIITDSVDRLSKLRNEWNNQKDNITAKLFSKLDKYQLEMEECSNSYQEVKEKLKYHEQNSIQSKLELELITRLQKELVNLNQNYLQIMKNIEISEGLTISSIRDRKEKMKNSNKSNQNSIINTISNCERLIDNYRREEKSKRKKKSSYNNEAIYELDAEFLVELEELLGEPIPKVDSIHWDSFGFTIKNKEISGLSLYKKNLKTLPYRISSLGDSILVINLRDNNFERIPEAVFYLTKIKLLSFENNKINKISRKIRNFKQLETLILFNNFISKLPQEICELNNLEYLNLNTNKVVALPQQIGRLSKLKILDLYSNQLESLPEGIFKLKQLERLYFEKNPSIRVNNKLVSSLEKQGGKVFC